MSISWASLPANGDYTDSPEACLIRDSCVLPGELSAYFRHIHGPAALRVETNPEQGFHLLLLFCL